MLDAIYFKGKLLEMEEAAVTLSSKVSIAFHTLLKRAPKTNLFEYPQAYVCQEIAFSLAGFGFSKSQKKYRLVYVLASEGHHVDHKST